jgi:hypothetical protein
MQTAKTSRHLCEMPPTKDAFYGGGLLWEAFGCKRRQSRYLCEMPPTRNASYSAGLLWEASACRRRQPVAISVRCLLQKMRSTVAGYCGRRLAANGDNLAISARCRLK